jgi:low temperature requirement protein LtrA
VIVGAVRGMAEVRSSGTGAVLVGILGVLVAIGLWWLYFDLASHEAPIARYTQAWLYLHLPLVMAIAAGGAGVLNTVEHAAEALPDAVRWLLVGALAAALCSVVLITLVLEIRRRSPQLYRTVDLVMLISAVLVIGVGLTGWGAKASLLAMVVLLLIPVGMGMWVWRRSD